MTQGSDLIRDVLADDVTYIYKHGFHPKIGATAVPALAELAEALSKDNDDGQDDYYRQVVEAVLRRAIHCLPREVRAGVSDLLGVDEPDTQRVGVRLNSAAEQLGFKSGESLRKSPRPEALLDELVEQLLALASEAEFAYTARFTLSPAPKSNSTDTLDSSELAAAQPLSHPLLLEVRQLCREGFDKAQEQAFLPTLNRLADLVIPGMGSTGEKLEVLLRRAVNEVEDDPARRKGITELLGLGSPRGLSFEQRRNRAAPDLGYETSTNPERYRPKEESGIILNLRERLLVLAVRAGVPADQILL
jgi:hypothetical protein